MKLFSAAQIYNADKITIEKQQITSGELMERASIQIFNWMHLRMQGAPVKIHLFCGIGNNGGDGMALARHLFEHGYNIQVYVVNYSEKRSKDFLVNLDRLKERKLWPAFLNSDAQLPTIGKDDIIVDAIFGIGLNRKPATWVTTLINHLNNTSAFILAIDIPSGLCTNQAPFGFDTVIKSNFVLSFQTPKLVFFLPETGPFIEQWEVLDIGLDVEYLSSVGTEYALIGKNEVLQHYRPREKYAHKGTYGHSLIVAGSYGKMGAAQLASKAALHIGSGLVTAYVPKIGYQSMQTALPEVMVITDAEEHVISTIKFTISPTVIGIGPGLGTSKITQKALGQFLKTNKAPLVIDADALNCMAADRSLLEMLPAKSILTPHEKELERLVGTWANDFDKLKKAKAFSKKYNVVLVLKGAHTITVYDNKGYINTTGNPGMATAGSGDVLTGVLTGLIAQGYESLQAAFMGVYLHGKAADLMVESTGYQALTASHIIHSLGDAFLDLFKIAEQPEVVQPEDE